ncbi:hypothetical protein RP20_CCG010935 [Aedes albopictus]|nr:hypothetical protein RP20_CCG010935 [Aedes albopictus]
MDCKLNRTEELLRVYTGWYQLLGEPIKKADVDVNEEMKQNGGGTIGYSRLKAHRSGAIFRARTN